MYLIYDTETNGLPKNYKAAMADLDNWPRVIQLAWQFYDEDGDLLAEEENLIVPDGWTIPSIMGFVDQGYPIKEAEKKAKFWTDNGFYTEESMESGIPIADALEPFLAYYDRSKALIAHNNAFDFKVLGAELLRANMRATQIIPKLCTMESSTDFCKIRGQYGKYKWPKLEEVYYKLFRENFDGAHDALSDVKACARVFFELKKRGLIRC